MTRRLAGHQKMQVIPSPIHRLVRLTGCNLDSFSSSYSEHLAFDLHGQFAFQHEKELAGAQVMMPDLAGARWHSFFNDVQFRSADEKPAITATSPGVMLRVLLRDNLRWHLTSM